MTCVRKGTTLFPESWQAGHDQSTGRLPQKRRNYNERAVTLRHRSAWRWKSTASPSRQAALWCHIRPAVFPRSAWGPGVLKGTSCSLNRDQQSHDQSTGSLPRQATGISGHRLSAPTSVCPTLSVRRQTGPHRSCRRPGVRAAVRETQLGTARAQCPPAKNAARSVPPPDE